MFDDVVNTPYSGFAASSTRYVVFISLCGKPVEKCGQVVGKTCKNRRVSGKNALAQAVAAASPKCSGARYTETLEDDEKSSKNVDSRAACRRFRQPFVAALQKIASQAIFAAD